jgi:hypothetical protein
MIAGIADRIAGKWRIIETAAWNKQHLDLCGPAFIEIDRQGRSEVAFGAVEATIDCIFTMGMKPPSSPPSGSVFQRPVRPHDREVS